LWSMMQLLLSKMSNGISKGITIKKNAGAAAGVVLHKKPDQTRFRCSIPVITSLSLVSLLFSLMFRRNSFMESALRSASS